MIHAGPAPPPSAAVDTKTAPRHSLFDIWATLKSSEEMAHDWPPKEIATLTVVEQAI
jgi:hypothetical protein